MMQIFIVKSGQTDKIWEKYNILMEMHEKKQVV